MNKKQLLVVFNTCGIKGNDKERLPNYIRSIESLLSQDFPSFRVVISACRNSDHVINELAKLCPVIVYDEVYPVNVTFNKTVLACIEKFGEAEGYIFVDSGIYCPTNEVLKRIYEVYAKDSDAAMVSVTTDTDTGVEYWFAQTNVGSEEIFRVPLDGALNLHFTLFSEELRIKYGGKILPDIFEAYCTESQFVGMCSAIKKKWLHLTRLVVEHNRSYDGPSSLTNKGHDAVYRLPKNMFEIMLSKDSIEAGSSYEAYRHILRADRSKYDANMYSIDDKLYNFLKNNIFLPKEYLDYDSIKVNLLGV